ncbi:hypothetical protein HY250_00160 [Candidatus Azambacteria bacterium]|nr:hypothetical protein [Candidatus Azambacteria bacterium]MBI3684812.1 hypothetical protein [Candidatus Azambacteria bacterium]
MRKIVVSVEKGKLSVDFFEGFPGDTCSDEEEVIRLLLAKMGVRTDVQQSDSKSEAEVQSHAEREKHRA